jgi:hypothetical protein
MSACAGCKRQLAIGAKRCPYCGQVQAGVVAARPDDGRVDVVCGSCNKRQRLTPTVIETLKARGTLVCMYCKSPAQSVAAAAPAQSLIQLSFACIACGRGVSALATETCRCKFCSMAMVAPANANQTARFVPPEDNKVSPPDVRAAFSSVGITATESAPWLSVLIDVLSGRADHDLGRAELVSLTSAASKLHSSTGSLESVLPLSLDDAIAWLPRLWFGIGEVGVDATPSATSLHMVVSTTGRAGVGNVGSTLLNGVGDALVAGLGYYGDSFVYSQSPKPDRVLAAARNLLCLDLEVHPEGLRYRLSNRVDNQSPTPLSVVQKAEVSQRLRSLPQALRDLIITRAVFGVGANPSSVFTIDPRALSIRLEQLGLHNLLPHISAVKMPPTFAT